LVDTTHETAVGEDVAVVTVGGETDGLFLSIRVGRGRGTGVTWKVRLGGLDDSIMGETIKRID
jgi:hypothetical protein